MKEYGDILFDETYSLKTPALVEASAGTGKTYQIQNAYLRLVVAEGVRVEKILVVTFTEAATRELRDRLRRILAGYDAYLHGRAGAGASDADRFERMSGLPVRNPEPDGATPEAARKIRIRQALMDFDHAPVFTIHGFCNRVLERYAFECGHDPDAELLPDDSECIRDRCRDWWRAHAYPSADAAAEVPFEHPGVLQMLVTDALRHPDAELRPAGSNREELHRRWQALHAAIGVFLDRRKTGNLAELKPQKGKAFEAALETLRELLTDAARPLSERARALEEAGKAALSATWMRPCPVPPDAAHVIEACASIEKQRGRTPFRSLAWTPDGYLRKGDQQIDPAGLRRAIKDHPGLTPWLEDPATAWGRTKAAAEGKAALQALLASAGAFQRDHEAAAFGELVHAVARLDRTRMPAPEEIGLDRAMPELAQALRAAREGFLALQAHIVEDVSESVRRRLHERRLLTYDQMLLRVREALHDPDRGPRLLEVLRNDVEAALIDEFQDTDPVQYDIFRTIFTGPDTPLVFVGDPKQAIYGFRSGDIFTYYNARKALDPARLHRLGTNFRSEPNLVAAVNALFADPCEGDIPGSFLNPGIRYAPVAARGLPDEDRLTVNGETEARPLKIWMVATTTVPGLRSPLMRHVVASVGEEIVRLLSDPAIRRGARPLNPSDIAVLAVTHAEAADFHRELARRNVPAVLQKTGNVFDTDEAASLLAVMEALLAPGNVVAVRAALCRDLMPCSAADLWRYRPDRADDAGPDAGPEPGRSLDEWMERFAQAGTLWRRRSFMEAFGTLARAVGLHAYAIGLPDGERKLTNMIHLADLAHKASRERKLGPEGLVRWFTRQLGTESREESEDAAVRLCSDENAVRILTVFKSKGLQFPVVFIPTLWRRSAKPRSTGGREKSVAIYHDEQGTLILDLRRENPEAREKEIREVLEENIRLAYVALTRAAGLAYLACVTGGPPEEYALQRLLARVDPADPPDTIDWTFLDGEQLPEAGQTRWAIRPAPAGREKQPAGPDVDQQHGQASFSSLVRSDEILPPVEFARDVDRDDGVTVELDPPRIDIFSIPGGARTGDAWHDLLEKLDFTAEPGAVAEAVSDMLDRTGICRDPMEDVEQEKRKAVLEMVRNVLKTPVRTAAGSFRLNQVPLAARRSELPFAFSLRQQTPPVTMDDVRFVLASHWRTAARDEAFLEALKTRPATLPLGFMTGFIDLVFLHEGRFYIADWKSNRRSGRASDFDAAGLGEEMRRHGYYLQYMIYAVAVDAFLRRKLEGYRFDDHFGGAVYFFLRGVDGATQRGLFHDPLSAELVGALSRLFAQGPEGGAV